MLGLAKKKGVLFTDGKVEPSAAWELYATKNDAWLLNGWSLDAITTPSRGGLGIAKDLYSTKLLEVDAGLYSTVTFADIAAGQLKPSLGIGISITL